MEYIVKATNAELGFNIIENPSQKNYYKHCHTGFEFLLFLEGDAEYVIEDRKFSLMPYDLIIIKPSQYHYLSIRSKKTYSRFVMNFQKECVPEILMEYLMNCPSVIKLDKEDELISLFSKPYRYLNEFKQNSLPLINSVITQIICLSAQKKSEEKHLLKTSPLTGLVIKYVNENLNQSLNLDNIAKKLFVSKSYMCHTFIKDMQITVMQYVRNKKILLAENLISSGESLSDAATKCGFDDYSTFYRLYKKIFGIAPSKYKTEI